MTVASYILLVWYSDLIDLKLVGGGFAFGNLGSLFRTGLLAAHEHLKCLCKEKKIVSDHRLLYAAEL